MKKLTQIFRKNFRRLVLALSAGAPRATYSDQWHAGWPPLSPVPLPVPRKNTAQRWVPKGPRDEWRS
jgi:hypothetical protein